MKLINNFPPYKIMMTPQTKLMIRKTFALNLSLNLETIKLKKINHNAEAIPTPAINIG